MLALRREHDDDDVVRACVVVPRTEMSIRRRTRAMKSFLAAVGVIVVGPLSIGGSMQSRIAEVKSIRCSFQRQATGAWKKDGPAEAVTKTASLVLRYDSIDTDAGTAQLRTGSVGSEVTVRLAEGYLHFMQAFRTGPLYTTTVFEAGASAGKFKAVHSRHELFSVPLPGATSSPEQYYGECEVVRGAEEGK
jgi:hypothetical protein